MKSFPGSPPLPKIERDPNRDLAGALHEVSNALTVVLGWLGRARDQEQPSTEALEQAFSHAALGHTIARRAVGAAVQTDGGSGGSGEVLRTALRGVAPIAAGRSVQLVLEVGHAEVPLDEPALLRQVLLNLLLNAISFSPQGGTVRLDALEQADRVTIRVQDEGPGLAREQRQELFKPGGSMRPGGAGLGLAHAHSLAESQGGELRLLDTELGACFEVDWPLAPESLSAGSLGALQASLKDSGRPHPGSSHAPLTPGILATAPGHGSPRTGADAQTPSPTPQATRARLDGLRVVALEDDSAISSLLEFSLRSRGVEFTVLETQQQFLQFIEQRADADVALIDLSPLGDQASALLCQLSAQLPDLDIFIISGCVTMRDLGMRIRGWIRKPFDMPEVIEALASTVNGRPRNAGGL